MTENIFIQKKIGLYKTLRMPSFLLQEAERFAIHYNLKDRIGVHIRYTDNLRDWSKLSLNTSLEVFREKIKHFNNDKLFIASDNDDVLDSFQILKANKLCPIYQGLYEMVLLSKTKQIIGSHSSTFSYEAAFMGPTNIELYENNQWNYYRLDSGEI